MHSLTQPKTKTKDVIEGREEVTITRSSRVTGPKGASVKGKGKEGEDSHIPAPVERDAPVNTICTVSLGKPVTTICTVSLGKPVTTGGSGVGSQSGGRLDAGRDGSREERRRRGTVPRIVSDSESDGRPRSPLRPRSRSSPPPDLDSCDDDAGNQVSEDDDVCYVGEQTSQRISEETAARAREIVKRTADRVSDMVGVDCPPMKVKEEAGRGRKVTTGERYLRLMEEAERRLIARAQELRDLREDKTAPNLSKGRRDAEKKAKDELRHLPTTALHATIVESVSGLDVVAEKSNALQGPYRGKLNEKAATIAAAVSLLAQRQAAPSESEEREAEVEELRGRVAAQDRLLAALQEDRARQQGELQELKREVEQLRSQARREEEAETRREVRGTKKRRKVIEDSSSPAPSIDGDKARENPVEEKMEVDATGDEEALERERSEKRRREILAELEEQGLPAVLRPEVQGTRRMLEPAVPAAAARERPEDKLPKDVEGRLASLKNELRAEMRSGIEELKGLILGELGSGKRDPKAGGKGDPAPTARQMRSRTRGRREAPVPAPTPAAKPQPLAQGKVVVPVPAPAAGQQQPQVRGERRTYASALKAATVPQSQAQRGRDTGPTETGWTRVEGRKAGKKKPEPENVRKPERKKGPPATTQQASSQPSSKAGKKRRRIPRTAAVVLTCPEDKYAEYMGIVRTKVALVEVGIEKIPNVRRTATGALSLEISGQDGAEKADVLAARMTEALAGQEGVKVSRPTMTADLRISGFEGSVKGAEVAETLAAKGGVSPLSVAVGPITVMGNGLCSVVAKCPLAAANALTRDGRVALGWSRAKVEMLEKRPLQCFKCLEMGHTRATCRSGADRTGACYRCGVAGHAARECRAPVNCVVCEGKGLPHGHRIGGAACTGCRPARGGRTGAAAKKRKPEETPKPAAVEKPKTRAAAKAKEGPKPTEVLAVSGFRVTQGGRLVAGVVDEPPKEKRTRPSRKTAGGMSQTPTGGEPSEKMEVEAEVPPTEGASEERGGALPSVTERTPSQTRMEVEEPEDSEEERERAEDSVGRL